MMKARAINRYYLVIVMQLINTINSCAYYCVVLNDSLFRCKVKIHKIPAYPRLK